MTDSRERWALILGGSSGMGEATARALAADGYNICGIHLDFRAALQHVEDIKSDLAALGRDVLYINMNAADDEKRAGALAQLKELFDAAKAALASHIRQLAMELARLGTGITANAIRAGVTLTPALMKIPEHDEIIAAATRRNPTGRMTTVRDVANAIVALSGEGTGFISGEVIGVDGAEYVTGS